MTVIAWDGKTLAADKRATYGNGARTVTKIRKIRAPGSDAWVLAAIAGDGAIGEEVLAWLVSGADPAKYPALQRDKDRGASVMLVYGPGVVHEYTASPHPLIYEDALVAIGCGRDFAIAAMHCGKTAREAVEIACLYDTGCGNGVDTLALD